MAINTRENENVNSGVDATNPGLDNNMPGSENTVYSNTMASNNYANSIGFGSDGAGIISSSRGSEYTIEIAQAILAQYKDKTLKYKPKVSILDKETQPGLAYSSLVVSLETNGIVSYFIILLEATGRAALTADEIMTEYETTTKNPNLPGIIYTADDAIDSVLHNIIQEVLKGNYPSATEFRAVDGLVVHDRATIDNIAPILAAIAYNACSVENTISTKQTNDLNIQSALDRAKGKQFKMDTFVSKALNVNELGDPVRTDWKIDLNLIDLNTSFSSLNLQNTKQIITRVGGYVDAIPEERQVVLGPGQPAITQIRLRPHIIITTISPIIPTFGYTLFGLISSLVMTQKNMWMGAIRPLDPKNNVGALNVLTNLNSVKEGGEKLNLADKKLGAEVINGVISDMFSLEPIISLDITTFGPQTFYTSAFSAAAQSGNTANKIGAANYIIQTASWLTSGRFPSTFPVSDIFATDGVVVPVGKWIAKGGEERDIREIDLAFIASHTDQPEFLVAWAQSNLPKHITGLDPYMTKVNILRKLNIGAVITGKAIRVTFSSAFIRSLEAAATGSGLNVRYEPVLKYEESSNLSIMNSYLSNAGLSGVNNYAHAITQAGPNYSTSYGNAWYGRQ